MCSNAVERIRLPVQHEGLLNGILGDWRDKLMSFKLKKDAKPYPGQPFLILQVHRDTVKGEVERVVEVESLKPI